MTTDSAASKKPGCWIPEDLNPQNFQSVIDVFLHSCKEFKSLPAYTCMGKTITYEELDTLSSAFAAYLQNKTDLQVGDRIAIQLPNVIQSPVAVFGAMKAGLIVVNTNPLYTPKELLHQFNDSGAKALVVFANMAHNVEKIIDQTDIKHVFVTEIADFHPVPKKWLINSVVKYVKKLVPPFSLPKSISFFSAVQDGKQLKANIIAKKPEEIAVLQYTGGTTGVAKGAMLTHANLISNMHQLGDRLSEHCILGEELYIAPLPLYHIYSFLIHGLTLVSRGAHTILIPNPRDIPGFVKELKNWKFSGFVGLNTLFVALCNNEEFKKLDFSRLKVTASGGMALTHSAADEWKRITGRTVIEGYGLTETSPVVSFNPVGKEKIGTIGLPVDHTLLKLLGENNQPVAEGEAGVLCVSGPQVMKGYWQREEATKEDMTDDGYFITGDIAKIHSDGYVQIVDRAKDMINVSGFNVYPTEIEDCLSSHQGILEAAAVGVPDDKTGEAVKAFVVLKNDLKDIDVEAVREFCREELAAYKVPKYVEVRVELPKTNVGKVLRRALRE
ncbi:AMP-binding protein [Marinomonas sp. 2405UD68-3]|uniref:AMP-binding protein n=1 Tax=Marinomonas sp. 2405UD68-3 TaxID=3391835 RepID=UPI0039C977B8